ncbi:unnamed protein product, partial [Brassica oleracea]
MRKEEEEATAGVVSTTTERRQRSRLDTDLEAVDDLCTDPELLFLMNLLLRFQQVKEEEKSILVEAVEGKLSPFAGTKHLDVAVERFFTVRDSAIEVVCAENSEIVLQMQVI